MGKQLSAHFNSDEFKCHDGTEHEIDTMLISILEAGRSIIGKPIHINSGYRSPAYNKKCGGAPKSQHMLGTAADITVAGMSPKQVKAVFERLMPDMGGIGLYKTFVHIDVRHKKTRWVL